MIVNTEFEITIFYKGKYLKLPVVVYYQSDQVQRFQVTAGHKILRLEKLVLKKPFKWKILSTEKEVNLAKAEEMLEMIKMQIEAKINPGQSREDRWKSHPKNS